MTDESQPSSQADARPRRRKPSGRPRVRAGAVIAVAAAAGFLVWVFAIHNHGSSNTSPVPRAKGLPVTVAGLRTLARAVGQPIYWVGPKRGFNLELTKTSQGRVYIRYLPKGVPSGTEKPYLTVGTYPVQNAYAVTRAVAHRPDSVKVPAGHGAVAFYGQHTPTNVYLAFPGSNYQVEVYDPSAARAQQLVVAHAVIPVGGASGTSSSSHAARATSPAALSAFTKTLGHAVYWAGTEPGTTYELTQLANGRVFVRYLPTGVAVGTRQPYLTIGTYPLKNALALTSKLLSKPDEIKINVSGGGVALYAKTQPTNVYVAYPGVDFQIEVYDPSPARARALVAGQRITPVG